VRCLLEVDVGVAGNEVLLRVERFEGDSIEESALFRFIFWRKYNEFGRFDRGTVVVV